MEPMKKVETSSIEIPALSCTFNRLDKYNEIINKIINKEATSEKIDKTTGKFEE
jgi:hypothetical protein